MGVVIMAARLTDKKKKKIVADYLELGSYNATAKKNKVCAYMESKRGVVCEIIEKGLEVLNDPEKLREASPAQITTALGTLIDKWAIKSPQTPGKDILEDDPITKSLKEEAQNGSI